MTTHTPRTLRLANDNFLNLATLLACTRLRQLPDIPFIDFRGPVLMTENLWQLWFSEIAEKMTPYVVELLICYLVDGATAGISEVVTSLNRLQISTFNRCMFSSVSEMEAALDLAELYRRIGRIPTMPAEQQPGSDVTLLRMLCPLQDDGPALIVGSLDDVETLRHFFETLSLSR